MKWFKHDTSAHHDAKLKKVRHKYGITGYGLYWYCVEIIAFGVDSKNITFQLEEDAETIAIEWGLDQLKVQEIMTYMCELGLFESNSGRITCLKLANRLDDTNSKNPEIKRILANLSGAKKSEKPEEKPNSSESLGDTPKDSDQIRLDKIREEENRLEKIKKDKKKQKPSTSKAVSKKTKFVKPALQEASEYFYELGSQVCQDEAQAFLDHFEANGWKVGRAKNPMQCWKASIRTWLRNSQKFNEEKGNELKNKSRSISGRAAVTFTDTNF